MNADVRSVKTPLLSPEQARQMLDSLVYTRLLACIDADAIVELEEELAFALQGCGIPLEQAVDEAMDLVRGALLRLALAPIPGAPLHDDDDSDDDSDDKDDKDDCELCRTFATATPTRPAMPRRSPRRPAS